MIPLSQQAETVECFLLSQRSILRRAEQRNHQITIAQCHADMPVLEAAMRTLKLLAQIGDERCRAFIEAERRRVE